MKTIALVDLSAVYWRYYHATEGEAQNSAKRMTLTFVRELYADFDDIKVALDCPPYRRKEIYPEYKANRPERDKQQIELLKQAQDEILKDGWSVLTCPGAEADDIIGTVCAQKAGDEYITIFGTDKDLLQVVGENVHLFDKFNNKEKTAENTLGVPPDAVIDTLALMGDKSDNIPGLPKVGPKTAIKLLVEFGTIDGLIAAIDTEGALKPSFHDMLVVNKSQLLMSRDLVTLDTNCEIVETKLEVKRDMSDNIEKDGEFQETDTDTNTDTDAPETAIVAAPAHVVSHEIVSYKQGLDPVGTNDLVKTSQRLYDSGLYGHIRTPQAIMAIIMRGREIGIGATTALDCIFMIKGKPTMSAQLLQGLVMASSKCLYFDCVESTDKIATFATKRKGSGRETVHSFTMGDADMLGLLTGKNEWHKQPKNMMRCRASSALCRLVYPDVVQGIYATEEME
jgi:5'-3' exonuclease